MTLLIAVILIYGLDLPNWLYAASVLVFAVEKYVLWRNVKDYLHLLRNKLFVIGCAVGVKEINN
jgi:hypothetical protein